MLHVLQSLRTGVTELADVPVPHASATSIVVETRASVISPGTERMLVEFGRAGWIEKARSQPEKVQQVLGKIATDGIVPTIAAVRAKLDDPVALGYCQAGIVREVGRDVTAFKPGDAVVTNGPHAEYVRVPQTLAAKIPAEVSYEAAAFAPLAAIALEGLRLANPTLGETVVVYGLGPIGLLAVQLARAAGCKVIGIDRSAERCALAEEFGATPLNVDNVTDVAAAVIERTGGIGADIVLLTLATESDEPVRHAANMSRLRGRIVLVGVTGLSLRRDDFYKKELSLQVSCSYGPGRYDPAHEEGGVDYPLAYVRWTEGRNFAAALDLMADGRLDPLPLITHRFPISSAPAAYALITNGTPTLGVVLSYDEKKEAVEESSRTLILRKRPAPGKASVGFIGAGSFASRVLIPAFSRAGASLDSIASGAGLSAASAGKRHDFHKVTSEPESLLVDPGVDTIVIATRHDSHADWTTRALGAGKHVFVEKPLALTLEELTQVAGALESAPGILCVDFNRRFAPHVQIAKGALGDRIGPLVISVTVNAGSIPRDHWTQDVSTGGGRIVGEACHFIDLCRFLAGSPVEELQVVSAKTSAGAVIDDISLLQLSFADGSIATIQYIANGNRRYPKERVELFYDAKTLSIDNFRTISAWGVPGLAIRWPRSQDKGHAWLVKAFVGAVKSGEESPIPANELLEVSALSIHAATLARAGGGTYRASSTTGRIAGR
jgi:predicted dehydrogenase/threonine dehydrogenase-like Zn-dependent dehydrogenase